MVSVRKYSSASSVMIIYQDLKESDMWHLARKYVTQSHYKRHDVCRSTARETTVMSVLRL